MLLKNIILVAFSTIVSQGNVASALPTNPVMNARSIPGPGQTAALLPRVLPDQLDAPVARGLQTRAAWDYNTLAGYIGSTAVYGSMLWGVEKCGAYCLRAAGVNYEAKIGKWAAAVYKKVTGTTISEEQAIEQLRALGYTVERAAAQVGVAAADPHAGENNV